MRITPSRFHPILLCGVALLMSGCPGLVPGSRIYQPLPQWEAKFFSQAQRTVFPDDVRQDPDGHSKTLVAWTGIVTAIEFFDTESSRVASFTATHHYFDWIEDFGIQRERFFLSPRGEGVFAAAWPVDIPADQEFVEQFAVGDMLIAYGYPSMIRDDVIGLHPTQNLRAIKPKWYSTEILEYGRPNEPTMD